MTRAACLTAVALLFGPICVSAQESLFQSSDGATSIYTQASNATLNFGDSKATIAYAKHDSKPRVYGYEIYAKASTGVSNLFSSDKPKVPEGGADVSYGMHWDYEPHSKEPPPDWPPEVKYFPPSTPEREKWWLIDLGYSRSSFYVSDTNVAPSAASRSFDRFRTIGVVNLTWNGTTIMGLAGGAERRNNLGDLKSVTFQSTVAAVPGSPNVVVSSKAGYYGVYKQYVAAPVYFDYLRYLPKTINVPGFGNRVAVDGFARADVGSANRSAKGGLGLYIFKKDEALTPLGGVTVSYDGSKIEVGVTTGFSLGK